MFISAALLPLVACTSHDLAAQQPKPPARRGTPAQIEAARKALFDGIDNVSRNPSAFAQQLERGTGCAVAISVSRPEKADSLREVQTFDAGFLSTQSRMSILPSGGIIELVFAPASDMKPVVRKRTLVANGVATPSTDTLPGFAVLIAETSRQVEVGLFMKSWTDMVQLCGGRNDA